MRKAPLSNKLRRSSVLRSCNKKIDSSEVLNRTKRVKDCVANLMKTQEQKDSAFLLFFASQNDLRDYNALPKHKFYTNVYSYSFSLSDFKFSDEQKYDGVIYNATIEDFEKCKENGIKKLNILLSGTGGEIDAILPFHKYLQEYFTEINVFVYDNVGSALAMVALSANNFYVKNYGDTASISKLDVQLPYWRKNENKRCLDKEIVRQVTLEKLLVAFDDDKKYYKLVEEAGHGYLYKNPFRDLWRKEYKVLIDEEEKDIKGKDVFCEIVKPDNLYITLMYDTYRYFKEKILSVHPQAKVDALTAPTSDLLAECGFGKAVYHHGSNMHTDQFKNLGIVFKEIESEPVEGSFFYILNEINEKCNELLELDDIKKIFSFNSSDVLICTEERQNPVDSIPKYFKQIEEINKKDGSYLGFRGQTVDHGVVLPSVFRNGRLEKEDSRYNHSFENCIDIFGAKDSMPSRNVSYSTPLNICKQQHYGIPTRFLDISFCPLAALYFACSDKKVEFGKGEKIENGVVYLFAFDEKDYDNLYAEQKVLAYSHLVKLDHDGKKELFEALEDCKRYITLIERYLNYVYSAAVVCENKNFLRKDFGYELDESPYIDSLSILLRKAKNPKVSSGIDKIINSLIGQMRVFVSYTNDDYKTNYALILFCLRHLFGELKPRFLHAVFGNERLKEICEKIFGKGMLGNKAYDICCADFLFSLEKEMIYIPEHAIAANTRLIKQKGLFLISGSEGRIATEKYHKLTITKSAKEKIFTQLKEKSFDQSICPWQNISCRICSCEKGFSYEAIYGDLHGQSKAIEMEEE